MGIYVCPVCGKNLNKCDNAYKCGENHSFDLSKSGYVNLLLSKHIGKTVHGDNKLMVKARRDFLDKGYYSGLKDLLCTMAAKYFDGDVSEIQKALNIMPENKVKGFVYVDEYEGKQRQAIAREYINLASNKYTDLEREIESINNNKGTNFTLCELQEYKVESSSFTQSTAQMPVTDNPFENTSSPWNN